MASDVKALGGLALFLLALFVVLFDDSLLIILKVLGALFFLYLLPGYLLLPARPFLHRLVLGSVLAATLQAGLGYYAGFVGIHASVHAWLVPLVVLGIALYVSRKEVVPLFRKLSAAAKE